MFKGEGAKRESKAVAVARSWQRRGEARVRETEEATEEGVGKVGGTEGVAHSKCLLPKLAASPAGTRFMHPSA